MRHSPCSRNAGNFWAAGLGILGLVVTTAIIVILFWNQTTTMVNTETGTIRAQDEAKRMIGNINMRNAGVDQTIRSEMSPSPSPSAGSGQGPSAAPASPSPSPVAGVGRTPATAPAASPSPMAAASPAPGQTPGGSAGGSPIGPISPVTPVAPIQEGPGPNLQPVKRSAGGINDAVSDRNKELEKMLEEGK